MIIFTPDQRRQVIAFLKRGEDGCRYSVGQDGKFYGDFGKGLVFVLDETMIDTALDRAGFGLERGEVEQTLVEIYGKEGDVSSSNISLTVTKISICWIRSGLPEAWYRIFGTPTGDARQGSREDSEAYGQEVPDNELDSIAGGLRSFQL